MTTFAESLKREIARIARKELKGDMEFLRKSAASHRGEIAALKRELKALQSEKNAIARQLKGAAVKPISRKETESTRKKPGRQVVYSAERFAAMRSKLGLTQAQMAKLLGVSSLSVYKWEKGEVEPREKQKAKVLSLRTLGKREVAERLMAEG